MRDGTGEILDDGLALWFPAPASVTGEDVVELHVHGGRAVVGSILDALSAMRGLRIAEPGEFSRRAFYNGKLDLTAAEGLADLIGAETAAQQRLALRQMRGELGALYEGWRAALIRELAHLEAVIDFADEDIPGDVEHGARAGIARLTGEIARHLADGARGERVRDGVRVAIIGPPNAGKSSLLNLLARRDAAIVADAPGTTRDVIEVHLDLGGYPVVVADTAGLRRTGDAVEAEGVRRAQAVAQAADLKLAVFDGAHWPGADEFTAGTVDADTVVVVNKADLGRVGDSEEVRGVPALPVSALTGLNIAALLTTLQREVERRWGMGAAPVLTRARHRQALVACLEALRRAGAGGESEVVAEEVRLAVRALGRITGRVDVEEILDVVFSEFCIGK